MFIDENIILLMIICVLYAIWELKVLIITFLFARPWPPHAPHFCPGYSRVLLRHLPNPPICFTFYSPILVWVAWIVAKWLKPPIAECKFAVVWRSSSIYCQLKTVRHMIYLLVVYFVDHIVGLHSTDLPQCCVCKEVNINLHYPCCKPL